MKSTIVRFVLVSLVVLAPATLSVHAAAPVVEPYFVQFQDINVCTGELADITFSGFTRTTPMADGFAMHFAGTATISGGYEGQFVAEWIIRGDRIFQLVVQDMEVNADGQRALAHTLVHTTIVDGQPKADIFSVRLDCVGRKS